jgi:very-short-patch-repair endonuclease
LRNRSLDGHEFRRQAVIGRRIVDFFCPAKGLVVEIDGMTHDPQADAIADRIMLRDHRFDTVRFTNEEVMRNLDGVLRALSIALAQAPDRWVGRAAAKEGHHPPTPSSKEEGEKRDAPSSKEEGEKRDAPSS